MSLTLIGTGIAFDLTVSGIKSLKQADKIYYESYTGPISEENIAKLTKALGKPVQKLERNKVESSFLINEAKTAKIALLVGGDALTATTHISLLVDAKAAQIGTKVISNSSIYTVAPGKAGLQIYRFGKTASLVNPRPNYAPTSAFEIIRKNLANDMHSLILLDTEPQPMGAKTALGLLEKAGFLEHKFVVLSRIGNKDEKLNYGFIPELLERDLGRLFFTLILPASLHPMEKEYLESI